MINIPLGKIPPKKDLEKYKKIPCENCLIKLICSEPCDDQFDFTIEMITRIEKFYKSFIKSSYNISEKKFRLICLDEILSYNGKISERRRKVPFDLNDIFYRKFYDAVEKIKIEKEIINTIICNTFIESYFGNIKTIIESNKI